MNALLNLENSASCFFGSSSFHDHRSEDPCLARRYDEAAESVRRSSLCSSGHKENIALQSWYVARPKALNS
ncbi:hypothetical protein K443DRAFT_677015 [Laccaria amethystina LaAM-08-1]|uniref:Uncharacterized protein n=1 Tax=Laccaria amethystina LaAM-08-1 TaxID=1095629 RepID=A0A0C9XZL1_9AGAR|nr:hypothetical protein K443DRAFT_677015 [Laccaria amethystina LaAM-08-1]